MEFLPLGSVSSAHSIWSRRQDGDAAKRPLDVIAKTPLNNISRINRQLLRDSVSLCPMGPSLTEGQCAPCCDLSIREFGNSGRCNTLKPRILAQRFDQVSSVRAHYDFHENKYRLGLRHLLREYPLMDTLVRISFPCSLFVFLSRSHHPSCHRLR